MSRKLLLAVSVTGMLLLGVLVASSKGSSLFAVSQPLSAHTITLLTPNRPLVAVGSSFTYQGQLTDGGALANGIYDFRFSLWDAPASGSLIRSAVPLPGQLVSGGLFTVSLDFGAGAFQGNALWLQIEVQHNSGGYINLLPRQPVSPTPYALTLVPGAIITGALGTAMLTVGNNGNGYGLAGISLGNNGVYGQAGANYNGVAGSNTSSGAGTAGFSVTGVGSYGFSTNGTGIEGSSANGRGVYGHSISGDGVFGESGNGFNAVHGNNVGNGPGVFGYSANGTGVSGISGGNVGSTANGVYGQAGTNGNAVFGNNIGNGPGVTGQSNGGNGIYGQSNMGYAGYFSGTVQITGNLVVSGTISKGGGSFKIDDPLDPTNKYLYHSFVESPDMKDIYDGIAVLDQQGSAWVTLPDWFEALNRDFRYQLTCIGGSAPIYIAQEITANRFQIGGGKPGLKVSWQVTGIRQDPYANQNRIPVVQDKPPAERGTYLHPEVYGTPLPTVRTTP